MRLLRAELEEERKKGRAIIPTEACLSGGSSMAAPWRDISPAIGMNQLVAKIAKLHWRLQSFDSKAKHAKEVLRDKDESRPTLCH